MPGFFLEAAKAEMGVVEAVTESVDTVRQDYQAANPDSGLRFLTSVRDTIWSKFDHLLYLPVLKLERPRDLYYYQGQGLHSLYGFTYKYLPLEQFLGQMTRLKLGQPLANGLAMAGYTTTPMPNEAGIILRDDGMTVYKGLRDVSTNIDDDLDGVLDGTELWVNLIEGMVNGFGGGIPWLSENPKPAACVWRLSIGQEY